MSIIVIINTMDGFSVGKILAGLRNPELYLKKLKQDGIAPGGQGGFNPSFTPQRPNIVPNLQPALALMNQLQMNQIAAMDRAIYIRNLLGLPQTLGQILLNVQDKNRPINTNTLLLKDLNQELLKNQKMIAQIFDDTPDASLTSAVQNIQNQAVSAQKDIVMLMFSGMVHLPAISELILKNSKHAVANLIIAMASASKSGMTSEQIQERLPLSDNVNFDLEIEAQDGENESNDSKLTVLIQTKNFGNVKGVFTLTTSNSVDIYIICSEDFPKKTLQKSLMEESSSHAMNAVIDIGSIEPKQKQTLEKQETKVNLSATNEMNPYLLLMAHAFIRNTIFIDTNAITEAEEASS